MKKVALHTLGCKLNYAETSTIGRQFVERGFEVNEFDQPSDVYVLNTCSVTERADKECRQIIRRLLRQTPDAYVIVTGCYAQLRPDDIASIDGVDLVLGAKEKFNIFEHAGTFRKHAVSQVLVSCIDEVTDFHSAYSAEVGGRTRAFLKVQDGCDFNCAFCTIPLARGASRSQTIDSILGQAHEIVAQGYKEIVLTGVNVGDYGRAGGKTFLELLRALELVDGVERIRISSIEPNLLTYELVDFVLSSEKFCNHFHIPLQSGSDTILKKMRRRYTTGDYRNLIEYIRMKDAGAGIGADVITGFHGETDSLFEETHRFLFDLPVSYLHVFTYSERPETPAILFDDPVESRLRFERSEILRLLGRKKRSAFHSSFIGTTLPVLYESSTDSCRLSGLTTNYLRVETPSDTLRKNQICDTRISAANDEFCVGTLLEPLSKTFLNTYQKENISTASATMFNPEIISLPLESI